MEDFNWLTNYSKDDFFEGVVVADNRLQELATNLNVDLSLFSDSTKVISSNEIKEIGKECAFQGFDIVTIQCEIMKIAQKLHPKLSDASETVRKEGKKSAHLDITMMCTFVANRSVNIDKIDDLGINRSKYRDLFMRWGIKNKLGLDNKQEGLTLSRICMAFPALFIRAQCLCNTVYRFGKVKDLEVIYHNTFAPAIIPRNEWGLNQMRAWTVWCKKFNSQINSGKPEQLRIGALKTTANIAKNQYESGYTHGQRLTILLDIYANLANSKHYEHYVYDCCFSNINFRTNFEKEIEEVLPEHKDTSKALLEAVIKTIDGLPAPKPSTETRVPVAAETLRRRMAPTPVAQPQQALAPSPQTSPANTRTQTQTGNGGKP